MGERKEELMKLQKNEDYSLKFLVEISGEAADANSPSGTGHFSGIAYLIIVQNDVKKCKD